MPIDPRQLIPGATPGRRVKILRVSRQLLASMFMQWPNRQVVVMDGLPDDAQLVGISEDAYFQEDAVLLKFESAEWPEVPEGHHVEEFRLEVSTINLVEIVKDALAGRRV